VPLASSPDARRPRAFASALLPSFLATRIEALQRDLRTIASDLSGRGRPPPFLARGPSARHLLASPGPDASPAPDPRAAPAASADTPQALRVVIHIHGEAHALFAQPDQTLLEAGLAASLPMPHSCTLGGCGTCRARLVAGSVVSEEPNCMSEEERAAGFILPCISRPTSACTLEVP
jgi:ferredoxin